MKATILVLLGFLFCFGQTHAVHYKVFKNKGPKCQKVGCSHKHYETVEEKSTTMILGHDERMLTCTGCGNTECKFMDLPKGIVSTYADVHSEAVDSYVKDGVYRGNIISFERNERIITSWSASVTEDETVVYQSIFAD